MAVYGVAGIRMKFARPAFGAATVGLVLPGDNEVVVAVSWSANDITLWPGESETLTASYRAALLDGSNPVVSVSGWNVSPRVVPAAYNAAP